MAVSKIHVSEKPELGRKLARAIETQAGDDPMLKGFARQFVAASDALAAKMAPRIRGTAESISATGAAAELDAVRDDETRALYYLLLGHALQRHDPATRQSARELLATLYVNQLAVVDFPYARQSAATQTLLENAARDAMAAKLSALPGAASFVTAVAAAEANFAAAIAATPSLRAAVTDAVEAIRAAEESWDGVLYGFLGALRQRYPGQTAKAKSAREALLKPVREVEAREKSRTTKRRTAKKPAAPGGDA